MGGQQSSLQFEVFSLPLQELSPQVEPDELHVSACDIQIPEELHSAVKLPEQPLGQFTVTVVLRGVEGNETSPHFCVV